MILKTVYLKDLHPMMKDSTATLRIYIADENETITMRPGMLVCPGGGYSFTALREGEPVACRFLSEGFNCFILDYTVNHRYPVPHLELAVAMGYIRSHEAEFRLLPNCLSIVGFSAGGHLVGSYGYLYKELGDALNIDASLLRPYSITMAYPVTLMDASSHQGTKDIICDGDEKLMEKLHIPTHVTKDYPPTFVWTTKDDDLVPSRNTVIFAEALKEQGVNHQCVIYESGWHGSSLANYSCCHKHELTKPMEDIRDWASLATKFIFSLMD